MATVKNRPRCAMSSCQQRCRMRAVPIIMPWRRNVVPEEIAAAMGDEDDEHRGAAKEIEARVAALAERRSLSLRHRINLAAAPRESAEMADNALRAQPPGGDGSPG